MVTRGSANLCCGPRFPQQSFSSESRFLGSYGLIAIWVEGCSGVGEWDETTIYVCSISRFPKTEGTEWAILYLPPAPCSPLTQFTINSMGHIILGIYFLVVGRYTRVDRKDLFFFSFLFFLNFSFHTKGIGEKKEVLQVTKSNENDITISNIYTVLHKLPSNSRIKSTLMLAA